MISLKKYLDSTHPDRSSTNSSEEGDRLAAAPDTALEAVIDAYGSALVEMGNCSLDACPGEGESLKRHLVEFKSRLTLAASPRSVALIGRGVTEQLREWGHGAARHYQQKACDVKEMLLAMARTAESVSARDQRCAGQMTEVTERLKAIASLEDLTQIRASIESSAAELRSSIDRMTKEGKAVLDQLQEQVSSYQAKLEEAEKVASRDALTGLSSRLYIESQIERMITMEKLFCVALIDIDHFKRVNDEYGHPAGDELLKQFGAELKSACRATDMIGRWGGDEFLMVFDAGLAEAEAQTARLRKWVCGNYSLQGRTGVLKVQVNAAIGLAAHAPGETLNALVERADAAMYGEKAQSRAVVA
jgi:diguanylate cyclase (GGDEF)-like protein